MRRSLASILALLTLLPACGRGPEESKPEQQTTCELELRSWIVLGRGRHLYLDCDCPPPFDHLDGRIEYTSASLRSDYDYAEAARLRADDPEWLPPITRMSRGDIMYSPLAAPDDRLEQRYRVSADVVEHLQRDTAFTLPYRLLGPNSNSAIRAVMESSNLRLPPQVTSSGGILGAFPGIAHHPGPELPTDQWTNAALPRGPIPLEAPASDGSAIASP